MPQIFYQDIPNGNEKWKGLEITIKDNPQANMILHSECVFLIKENLFFGQVLLRRIYNFSKIWSLLMSSNDSDDILAQQLAIGQGWSEDDFQ